MSQNLKEYVDNYVPPSPPEWQHGTAFEVKGGWAFVIRSSAIADRSEAITRMRRANTVAAMDLDFNQLNADQLYNLLKGRVDDSDRNITEVIEIGVPGFGLLPEGGQ